MAEERRGSSASRAAREIEALKVRLVVASRAVDNLLAAIEGGGQGVPQRLVDQLAEREAERKRLSQELMAMPPPAAPIAFDLEAYCSGIQARLASPNVAEVRQALRTIVERVVVPRPDQRQSIADVTVDFRQLPE